MGNLIVNQTWCRFPGSCHDCGCSLDEFASLEIEYCPKCGIRILSEEQPDCGEEDLFQRAQSLGTEERSAFLAKACGDDQRLRQRIGELLAAADCDDSMLDFPPTEDAISIDGPTTNVSGTTIGNYKLLERIGEND